MNSGRLDGRIAVITGGANGQGAATARLFAQEGARVVICDVASEAGEALAREIGENAIFAELDVADEDGWIRMAQRVGAHWGAPDVLINNAGIGYRGAMIETPKADFERVLEVNLLGPWLGIKTLAPGMIAAGKGAIVNTCSTVAVFTLNGNAPYSASKWALRGLTRTAAMELGHHGIRVNATIPGAVNTGLLEQLRPGSQATLGKLENQPISRMASPEELAKVNLFLASDESSYMCGAEVVVDGGMTLGHYRSYNPGAPDSM